MKSLFILVLCLGNLGLANEITVELGHTQTVNNYFQIPNQGANRVDLPEGEGDGISARLTGRWNLSDKYFLYFLFAPLKTSSDFLSQAGFDFNDTSFTGGTQTNVSYKFNSYRVGFFRKWKKSNWDFWGGLVLKVRDAEIIVTQGNQTDSYDNVGIVPLLGGGLEWRLNEAFSVFSHIDILGASQGYAYDVQAEVRYWLVANRHALAIGYRSLGGGADNDKVQNFAQFDTTYLSYTYKFQ